MKCAILRAVVMLAGLAAAIDFASALGVTGVTRGGVSARFAGFSWQTDGSMEIRGQQSNGTAVALGLTGLRLGDFPATRIDHFQAEANFLPDGPAFVVRFFDRSAGLVGIVATNFRFAWTPFGDYRVLAGKPVEPLRPQGGPGMLACAVLLSQPKGPSIPVMPGEAAALEIDGVPWNFSLARAAARKQASDPGNSVEGPAFSADFYAFARP